MCPDDLAVLDDTAPALHLVGVQDRARHHMPAEVLELQPRSPARRPPNVARALHEPLRVVLEHHQDGVRVGPSSWNVTAPSTCPFAPVDRHTIRSSGDLSTT